MDRHWTVWLAALLALSTAMPAQAKRQKAADIALEAWGYEFGREEVRLPAEELDDRYRRACRRGYRPACDPDSWRDAGYANPAKANGRFEPLCIADDPHACVVMGWAIANISWQSEYSPDDVVAAMERACDLRLDFGCFELARLFRGEVVPDTDRALPLLSDLCERDFAPACNELGQVMEEQQGSRQPDQAPFDLYKRSCSLGYGWGCYHAAEYLRVGIGVEPDSARSARLFERAATYFAANGGEAHPGFMDSLRKMALIHGDLGDFTKAVPLAQRSLSLCESNLGPYHEDTAVSLRTLADLYRDQGDFLDALSLYEQALAIQERVLGPGHEETLNTLVGIVRLHDARHSHDEAVRVCQMAISGARRSQRLEHPDWVALLDDLASLQLKMALFDEALAAGEESLEIKMRILGLDDPATAQTHVILGLIHEQAGSYSASIQHLERALTIQRQTLGFGHWDTLRSLHSLATIHSNNGSFVEALEYGELAADQSRGSTTPKVPEAAVESLVTLAGIHLDMGAFDEALRLYEAALEAAEISLGAGHFQTGEVLNGLALVHQEMGAYERAVSFAERALAIGEEQWGVGHWTTTARMGNLANLYGDLGMLDRALLLSERALTIREDSLGADHPDTAIGYNNLALLYKREGDTARARVLFDRSLSIALRYRLPRLLWSVSFNLALLAADLDLAAEAIFWAKLSVNQIQAVRGQMTGMGRADVRVFVESVGNYYRVLAELLIQSGRLPEAEQVLREFKETEYDGFTRRDAEAAAGEPVDFTVDERAWVNRLEAAQHPTTGDALEYRRLRDRRLAGVELSAAELVRLNGLSAEMAEARKTFEATLDEVRAAFVEAPPERIADLGEMGLGRLRRVQGTLTELGPGTVLISTVVTEDTVHLLLTTQTVQVAERTEIRQGELDQAILQLRTALASPSADPRTEARRMYDILIRPVEKHLDQAEARFLMVSLDANLRYLPLAALHDGEKWLVERWPTAIYTPAAEADLRDRFEAEPRVGALGVSTGGVVGDQPFNALPAVPGELDSIVWSGDGDDRGIVPGDLYLDEDFTSQQLSDVLATGTPWVHLASHFHFRPGVDADNYLLLGNDEKLTLADLRYGDFPLNDVDQLTLSACETAMGAHGADGREVEGLAVLAQNLGARAVLATLWSVADESTASWMSEMYRLRSEEGLNKAEAVRQTQLRFISGEFQPAGDGDAERGAIRPDSPDADLPEDLQGWRHPFYWAPYVLMGNWR